MWKDIAMATEIRDTFFRIQGGYPISGDVSISGNKNEALPLIACSLLAEQMVILENVPDIQDIRSMLAILGELGVKWSQKSAEIPAFSGLAASHSHSRSHSDSPSHSHSRLQSESHSHARSNSSSVPDKAKSAIQMQALEISIDPSTLKDRPLPQELCILLRASICLAAPLLVRFGRVCLPFPGGDRIGRRRLDSHILALTAMGAKVSVSRKGIELLCDELKGADILLDECSVTATENAVMAACFAKGTTLIRNAACEPHVQRLCSFLNQIVGTEGARSVGTDGDGTDGDGTGGIIEGIGSNVLRIKGLVEGPVEGRKVKEKVPKRRHDSFRFRVSPDYLEVGSLVALGALCGGPLRIFPVQWQDMRPIVHVLHRLGIQVTFQNESLLVEKGQSLTIQNDFADEIPRIDSAPWPGFPADMTSIAVVTATQCKGSVLIHEKMFESRLFFLDALIGMGARIILCDPHRAVIMGPAKLHGTLLTSPDIRAGMALLIAALCAQGESIIRNIVQIDRGFSQVEKRLQLLGAKIERVEANG